MGDQVEQPAAVSRDGSRRLSYRQLQWVLERATSLTDEDEGGVYSALDALALGRELGIEDRVIHRALRELDSPTTSVQAGRVTAEAILALPAPIVARRLDEALRKRLMDRCPMHAFGCWTQRRDWWPDLQRLGSEIHVMTGVRARSSAYTQVRVQADLRPKAAGYGTWAGGGSALVWLVLGPGSLVPAIVAWAGIGVAAIAAYRRRADAINARFEELITEIA